MLICDRSYQTKSKTGEKSRWTILEEIKEHEIEKENKRKVQPAEKNIISTSDGKLKENALK